MVGWAGPLRIALSARPPKSGVKQQTFSRWHPTIRSKEEGEDQREEEKKEIKERRSPNHEIKRRKGGRKEEHPTISPLEKKEEKPLWGY